MTARQRQAIARLGGQAGSGQLTRQERTERARRAARARWGPPKPAAGTSPRRAAQSSSFPIGPMLSLPGAAWVRLAY